MSEIKNDKELLKFLFEEIEDLNDQECEEIDKIYRNY